MPGSRDPNVIDGLSSIRAVRRAGEAGHARKYRTRPSQTRVPGPKRQVQHDREGQPPASRIGHTVMPQKHELLCYECGYPFVLHGIIHNPICPKCHRKLIKDDLSIESNWAGDVKTIGNVEIKPGGTITSGRIVARDIIIEGNAEKGLLHAGRRIELGHGARFAPETAEFKDIRIRPGARISIRRKLSCRDLYVEGELTATVFSSGTVSVKRGGFLRGKVNTEHLTVEDGGGLKAGIRVEPDSTDNTVRPT